MSALVHDPRLHETLVRLARAAGAEIMAVRDGGDLGARSKDDDSPVTRADLAADRVIFDGLRAAFPTVPVVTEERPETHGASGCCFLVDPLDGTRDFLRGSPDFTVNIALVADDAPVAGVVFAPASGELFATDAEGRAVGVGPDGRPRLLRVAAPEPGGLRAVASASHRDAATQRWLDRVAPADVRAAGSSLKFCLIAAGEADVYPRFGPTMHWDTAAAHAVLAAAGGRVVRIDDLTPLRYPPGDRRNPGFLAVGALDPATLGA